MINTLKQFKADSHLLASLKLRIKDLKQVECSPLRVGTDQEAINYLDRNGVDLKQVQYDLQLSGYVNDTLNAYLLEVDNIAFIQNYVGRGQ